VHKPLIFYGQVNLPIRVDDRVSFGRIHEQAILWRVLRINEDGDLILRTNEPISTPYHNLTGDSGVDQWFSSPYRKWLNNRKDGFLKSNHFTDYEYALLKANPLPEQTMSDESSLFQVDKVTVVHSMTSDYCFSPVISICLDMAFLSGGYGTDKYPFRITHVDDPDGIYYLRMGSELLQIRVNDFQ
jgi:hypothetical protein